MHRLPETEIQETERALELHVANKQSLARANILGVVKDEDRSTPAERLKSRQQRSHGTAECEPFTSGELLLDTRSFQDARPGRREGASRRGPEKAKSSFDAREGGTVP